MAETEARAFWITAPGRGEIRSERLPPPADDEVLVVARFSGISRGTESIVFNGRVPPTEYARMRAPFQAGQFPAPVKYGYASVGRVEHGPAALRGRDVFVLYPHQTRYVVPASAVFAIPAEVPPSRAVLAANMETATNVLWDADVRAGDRVAVVGGGTIGCLVAWLAQRSPGCEVELIDINPRRADVAAALGLRFSGVDGASRDADVVVHASGSPDGLALALSLAAFEATIVEASWFGAQSVALPLGEDFHARRLTIKSSQVGAIATPQRTRWDSRRRMSLALRLLASPALDALISGDIDFESLPETMPRLLQPRGVDVLCQRIRYS